MSQFVKNIQLLLLRCRAIVDDVRVLLSPETLMHRMHIDYAEKVRAIILNNTANDR